MINKVTTANGKRHSSTCDAGGNERFGGRSERVERHTVDLANDVGRNAQNSRIPVRRDLRKSVNNRLARGSGCRVAHLAGDASVKLESLRDVEHGAFSQQDKVRRVFLPRVAQIAVLSLKLDRFGQRNFEWTDVVLNRHLTQHELFVGIVVAHVGLNETNASVLQQSRFVFRLDQMIGNCNTMDNLG